MKKQTTKVHPAKEKEQIKHVVLDNDELTVHSQEERFLTFPISIIPTLLGITYISGYILVSWKLRFYHVAPIYLFDAQYFLAGIFPSVGILIIYLIIYYVWNPEKFNLRILGKSGKQISESIKNKLHLYQSKILIVGYLIATCLWILFMWNSKSIIPSVAALTPMGAYSLFAIGVFVYRLRIKLTKTASPKNKKNAKSDTNWWAIFIKIFSSIFIFVFSVTSILIIAITSIAIYEMSPLRFGGGKPTQIELILDTKNLSDLENHLIADTVLGRTKPLCLIYASQNNFIVADQCKDFQQLWVLDSKLVLGEVLKK